MPFRLEFALEAAAQLQNLASSDAKKHKKAKRALGYLETNPRHSSLNTHKFHSLKGPKDEEVFEAYIENQTPAAGRILFCYKDGARGVILVVAIIPHP